MQLAFEKNEHKLFIDCHNLANFIFPATELQLKDMLIKSSKLFTCSLPLPCSVLYFVGFAQIVFAFFSSQHNRKSASRLTSREQKPLYLQIVYLFQNILIYSENSVTSFTALCYRYCQL